MNNPEKEWVLAGDIGGTKTNLGLFAPGKRRPALKIREMYQNRAARSLEELVGWFLKKHPAKVSRACFGIAGPVDKGRAKLTNLSWKVEAASIKRRFRWQSVCLVNDLVATALAIPVLTKREVVLLKSGKKRTGESVGLVAPGTGLGMALLAQTKSGYTPMASEGGHADFGPNNDREAQLWRHLRKRFGHVSAERVLSGPGLNNIYMWLRDSGTYREPAWLKINRSEIEPAQAITDAALSRRTPLAIASLEMFVAILGSVAGNLALTGMTTGGIYLGGGIPPKILPFLKSPFFMEAFVGKGRFRPLLERMPVHVILNDKTALLGAAVFSFCSD